MSGAVGIPDIPIQAGEDVNAMLQHPIGRDTVEDWRECERPTDGSRLELIWGYFHATPPPTGQHQYAVDELCSRLWDAVRRAGRKDLYPVTGVGVEISTALRTALIPDLVVLDTRPVAVSFSAANVVLAAEVWSPGNGRGERETKAAAYAAAGVPFFWAVEQDHIRGASVTACRLDNGRYVEEITVGPGGTVTVTAAPVPVTFDPAELIP